MHFHWDDFDSILARFAAQVALPIFNAIVMLVIFGATLGHYGQRLFNAVNQTAEENLPKLDDLFGIGVDAIKKACPGGIEELCGIQADNLGAIGDGLLDLLKVSWLAFLYTLVSLIILVVALNYLTRLASYLAPFKLVVHTDAVANQMTLDSVFYSLPKAARAIPRYKLWLHARMVLDAATDQGLYHAERNRLLRQIEAVRRLMSYANVYLVLAILRFWLPEAEAETGSRDHSGSAVASKDVDSAQIWILLSVAVLIFSCVSMFRLKTTELIRNDIEAFASLPRSKDDDMVMHLERAGLRQESGDVSGDMDKLSAEGNDQLNEVKANTSWQSIADTLGPTEALSWQELYGDSRLKQLLNIPFAWLKGFWCKRVINRPPP